MRKKLLSICIGTCLLSLCLGAVACEEVKPTDDNNNDSQTPSLAFERVDDGYAVVGIGTYEDGIVVIPDQYDGQPVTEIAEEAFAYETEIGILTIPDTVKRIEARAFKSCSNLSSVTLGKNVSYIAEEAFAYCHNMGSITNTESVVTIGSSAFFNCARLKSIAFSDALEVVSDNAFTECKRLESVTFGSGLETIGERAFYNCIALQGVEIPDGAPTQIMKQAFWLCEALEYVWLGNDVIDIGESAFESCGLLRDVSLGDGVESIGASAFSGCRKFYQLTLGESLVSIGKDAFNKCWLIREIVNRSSLSIVAGSSDHGGVALYAWYVRTGDQPTRISKDENGLVYYTDGARKAVIAIELSKMTEVVIPDDVTEIGAYAGYGVQFISGLVIGDNCTTIGEGAFRYNGYIVTLVINKNLKKVGAEAFMKKEGDKYYKAYKDIYFEGTQAEWDSIRFADGNDHLIGEDDNGEPLVNLAFYSETQPTANGSYWHYVDGKPTLWK